MDLVGKRTVTKYIYHGVESSYTDITFTMNLRRRTLYYWSNLILPCILIGEFLYFSANIKSLIKSIYNSLATDNMYGI